MKSIWEDQIKKTKTQLDTLAVQMGTTTHQVLIELLRSNPIHINILSHSLSEAKQDTSKDIPANTLGAKRKSGDGTKILEIGLDLVANSTEQLQKTSSIIIHNLLEQMASRKIYKIRQNFRKVILDILDLQELRFFMIHESGRIEYQDFSSNFVTEILETDSNHQFLKRGIFSPESNNPLNSFFLISENPEFKNLFEIIDEENLGESYGMLLKDGLSENEYSVCLLMVGKEESRENITHLLTTKLIHKIVEISQINTTEGNTYSTSKIYSKKMLDLLEIYIIQVELKLKKGLMALIRANKEIYYSINNAANIILSRITENSSNKEAMSKLKSLASLFEEAHYRKIEEIRMYKKYVSETNLTLLEFSSTGVLQFMSGNHENELLDHLTNIWEKGRPILETLFPKNLKLEKYMKRSIRGSINSERLFEISQNVKGRITSYEKKVAKIFITIEEKEVSNLSDPTFFCKSENILKERIHENWSENTMRDLGKENPGILNEGWLNLYLKESEMKMPPKNQSHKKNKTYMANLSNSQAEQTPRQMSCFILKETEELNECEISDVNLNVLVLGENELESLTLKILLSLDYFRRLPHEKLKLEHFVSDLRDHYEIHSNEFHNFRHGVNVMHACFMLSTLPSNFNILTEKEVFAIVFSGLCHDVGHTGFTNAFESVSKSPKALVYNDKSPLENYHASLTFELLKKKENNFLSNLGREEFMTFRKLVIENILWTDIKEHFTLLSKFNELLNRGKEVGREDACVLSYFIVHSSDFAGSIKEFEICKEWSRRVNIEFSNQYRVEGEMGLPQTPFMKDVTNPLILSKAEGGFLNVIVYPLYEALDRLYIGEGIVHKMKKNLSKNIKSWEELHKAETEKVQKEI